MPGDLVPQVSLVDSLKQLIVALDARHIQPSRPTEASIAADAAELRAKAVARLAELTASEQPAES